MMKHGFLLCFALVFITKVSCKASSGDSLEASTSSRMLLQRRRSPSPSASTIQTTEGNRTREEIALAEFAAAQERRANETRRIIQQALSDSEDIVERYLSNNNTLRGRVAIFQELLQNADGVTAKFALNTLSLNTTRAPFVRRNVQAAIARTIRDGFGTNVAEAIADALTIFQAPNDQYNLLDAISERQEVLETREEGSGCAFINALFTDADTIAYDRGEATQFMRALSSDEYVPIVECFLDECTGPAASCCTSRRALRRGLCGCPNRRSNRCDFNLFVNQPRTVWTCSSSSCEPNDKCLCPASSD